MAKRPYFELHYIFRNDVKQTKMKELAGVGRF